MKKIYFLWLCLVSILFMSGCSNDIKKTDNSDLVEIVDENTNVIVEEEETQPVELVKLYLDVQNNNIDTRDINNISILVDDKECIVVDNEKYYSSLIEVEKGQHIVSFVFNGIESVENEKRIEVSEDMTVEIEVTADENTLNIKNFETINSVADSQIEYSSFVGMNVTEALKKAETLHFVYIEIVSDNEILNPEEWEINGENRSEGEVLDKNARIELTATKVYSNLYFDLDFVENLFFSKYDIDLFVDDHLFQTLKHGKYYTGIEKVHNGKHTIKFCKASDNSVFSTKEIEIQKDSTFKSKLETESNEIKIEEYQFVDSIVGAELLVPNVVGAFLTDAQKSLEQIGFSNVSYQPFGDIWDTSNWIVTTQSVNSNTVTDKNTAILLNCVQAVDFLTQNYLGKSLEEVLNNVDMYGHNVVFKSYLYDSDITSELKALESEERDEWVVKQASVDNKTIIVKMVYRGYVEVPNLKGLEVNEAVKSMKNLGFSGVVVCDENNNVIEYTDGYLVDSQSVDGGKKVNADGKIVLNCRKKMYESNSSSTSNEKPNPDNSTVVYHEVTNDERAKYKRYIIDESDYDKKIQKIYDIIKEEGITQQSQIEFLAALNNMYIYKYSCDYCDVFGAVTHYHYQICGSKKTGYFITGSGGIMLKFKNKFLDYLITSDTNTKDISVYIHKAND